MNEKKINRYSIVELIDTIKHSTDKNLSKKAETELESRDLSEEKLKTANAEFEKFKKFQIERKDKPLSNTEWLTFFFLPLFRTGTYWIGNSDFFETEFERFENYGYERKIKEAAKVQKLGIIFWFLLIIVISLATRLYGN